VRTAFQVIVALATLTPFIVTGVYNNLNEAPEAVVQVVVLAGVITKVMALPQVEDFLQKFVPWLSAEPSTQSVWRKHTA